MAYQQPPYQTTVMQPVVVQPVLPVVVPVVSGHNTQNFCGPAYLKNGAKLGSCHVPGRVICFMSVFGGMMLFQFIILQIVLSSITSSMDYIIGLIAAPFIFITCYLCIVAKKNYDKERSQENTAPYSEPFTDVGNSQGFGYSGQGQPTASPMYVPVPSGVPPPYPHQTSGIPYPNTSSFSQPGMAAAPGCVQYPEAPSYSESEKSFPPEYGQQPSYAPPRYSQ